VKRHLRKPYLKTVSIVTLGSFLIGVGFGAWREHRAKAHIARTTPLRVLCEENWLDGRSLEKVARRLAIPIQLITYSRPSEFLRQMANSDSNIDVICTSSFLVRSLVHSRWLKKIGNSRLPNLKQISVDFVHLPYDAEASFTVPLFWNLYGLFGKHGNAALTWKQAFQSKRLSIWGDELNILYLMSTNGVDIAERLAQENDKTLESDIRSFIRAAFQILEPQTSPVSAEAVVAKADWIQLPLSLVSRLIGGDSPYQFWLPEDGGAIEVGVLAVGEKSTRKEEALALINELISTEHALEVHQRLKAGVVHASLSHLTSIAPFERPEALRRFPLNRFKFPDMNLDAIPRFQKVYDETKTSNRK
jgi:spermidine/putrescine-binding protein